jgi:hypothetical protein
MTTTELALGVALVLAGCVPTQVDDEGEGSDNDEQCRLYEQDLQIFSMDDVLALEPMPCLLVRNHALVIESTLSSLEGLEKIREVRALRVQNNEALIDLHGLERLKVTGEIVLADNRNLRDIGGIVPEPQLEKIELSRNPSLRDLTPLRGVEILQGKLLVEGGIGVENLGQLERLQRVGELTVQNTWGLSAITLRNLERVSGGMKIAFNQDLIQLADDESGFGSLSSVEGDLTLQANDVLQLTNGFTAKFQTVGGSLVITDNTLLADVYDLENLYSVGGSLIITYNPLLSICRAEDLDEFIEQVGADVDIGDNSPDYDPCYEELD